MPLPATQPRGATRPKHHEMHYIFDCRMATSLRPGLYSNSAPEVKHDKIGIGRSPIVTESECCRY